MNIQETISNAMAVQRAKAFANSNQLSLGELILQLKALPKREDDEPEIRFDFCDLFPTQLMSWRGIYAELALSWSDWNGEERPPKLSAFIKMLEEAVGKTFEGYKGGDFTMTRQTPIWVAHYGESGNTAVVGVKDCNYMIIILTTHQEF